MSEGNNKLENKSILLFSQYFFGYEEKIADKLREFGSKVVLYDEMSVKRTFERAMLKISPAIFKRKTEKYYGEILEKEKKSTYDYILFIDCEMPTEKVLKEYRETFSNAKFCLHMWDALKNLPGVKEKFKYFDYISSFDRKDAEENKIIFRPLFFIDEYRYQKNEQGYDYNLSFIGTIHSDRYAIIKKFMNSKRSLFTYPYLQSRFIYYFYKVTKKEFRDTRINDFKFKKMNSQDIAAVVNKSRAVLDIQHPGQTGLTIRTLEMLGMKKKFVTTNQDIQNYDFFNLNNIFVIDRANPYVPDEFYDSDYEELPSEVYEYYSINRWVADVLGIMPCN